MVSTQPPTSKSSRPLNNPLVTVPKAPITIGIIVTFMFHVFFLFPSKVEVLILHFTFFQFYSVVSRDSKVDNFVSSLFLLIIIIPLPTQLCLVLYSFCANLLHSLVMWLMVSSLSPHRLHLLFCCCNQSSFVFFSVFLESLYGCVKTVFHAGKSSSSLLSW